MTTPATHLLRHDRVLRSSVFVGLVTAVVTAFRHSFVALITLAWARSEYTHTLVILPICIALISGRRQPIFRAPSWDGKAAFHLASIGAVLASIGLFSGFSVTLSIAAAVAFCISAFLLCFGVEACQQARFPLLLLFLLVPLPNIVTNLLIGVLQKGSVQVAYHLLHYVAVPVTRDGVLLHLPGLDLEVAAECSSIRSGMLLLVVSLVLMDRLLGRSWQKLLALVLVLPVAILKNGIRIFTLATLATYVDPGILSSWIHRDGGFLFFALGVGMMLGIIRLLGAGSENRESRPQNPVCRMNLKLT